MSDKPQTSQDLLRQLADELVAKEVIEPMEAIGWSHATPPAPRSADNPQAGGAPQAAQQPVADAGTTPDSGELKATDAAAKTNQPGLSLDIESFKDASGMYLGKYKTPEEFLKGSGHVVNMAKQAFSERDQLRAELDRLQKEVAARSQFSAAATPAAPAVAAPDALAARAKAKEAQQRLEQVLSRISEDDVVLDGSNMKPILEAMREASRAEARAEAEELLLAQEARRMEEYAKGREVDEYMTSKYPDAMKFADEVGLHVQANPLLASAIQALAAQGKQTQAAEMAWLDFARTNQLNNAEAVAQAAAEKSVKLSAAEQVRKEAVEQARKDAGLIEASTTGGSEPVETGPSEQEVRDAAAAMLRQGVAPGTPAGAHWRELTIGRHLPPELFG